MKDDGNHGRYDRNATASQSNEETIRSRSQCPDHAYDYSGDDRPLAMRVVSCHADAEENTDNYSTASRYEPTCPTVRFLVIHNGRGIWSNGPA